MRDKTSLLLLSLEHSDSRRNSIACCAKTCASILSLIGLLLITEVWDCDLNLSRRYSNAALITKYWSSNSVSSFVSLCSYSSSETALSSCSEIIWNLLYTASKFWMRDSISSFEVTSKLSVIRFRKFFVVVNRALMAPLCLLNCSMFILPANRRCYLTETITVVTVKFEPLNSRCANRNTYTHTKHTWLDNNSFDSQRSIMCNVVGRNGKFWKDSEYLIPNNGWWIEIMLQFHRLVDPLLDLLSPVPIWDDFTGRRPNPRYKQTNRSH